MNRKKILITFAMASTMLVGCHHFEFPSFTLASQLEPTPQNGKYTEEFESGETVIGYYQDGERDGTWKFLDKNGQCSRVMEFENGRLCCEYQASTDTDGNEIKNGECVEYAKNGNVTKRFHYHNDLLDGEYFEYHEAEPENNWLKVCGQFDMGKKVGEWTYFADDAKDYYFRPQAKEFYNSNGEMTYQEIFDYRTSPTPRDPYRQYRR